MLIAKGFFAFFFICVVLLTFNFCTSDNSTNPSEQNLKNYYPGQKGTSYKYVFKKEDSNITVNSGLRFVTYGDNIYIDTVKYREQKDSLNDGVAYTENVSYFRNGRQPAGEIRN